MRHWRYIRDVSNFVAGIVKCANCGLTSRAWALDLNIEVLKTVVFSGFSGTFSSNLSGERRTFARSPKPRPTRRSPGKRIPLTICDCHNGIIKRRVDMCHTVYYRLFDFFYESF